jgi:hypothetical protein
MSAKFIKLNGAMKGETFFIDADAIYFIGPPSVSENADKFPDARGAARCSGRHCDIVLLTTETPEQILALIEGAKP